MPEKTITTTVDGSTHFALTEAAEDADQGFESFLKKMVMARVRQIVRTQQKLNEPFRGPQKV